MERTLSPQVVLKSWNKHCDSEYILGTDAYFWNDGCLWFWWPTYWVPIIWCHYISQLTCCWIVLLCNSALENRVAMKIWYQQLGPTYQCLVVLYLSHKSEKRKHDIPCSKNCCTLIIFQGEDYRLEEALYRCSHDGCINFVFFVPKLKPSE